VRKGKGDRERAKKKKVGKEEGEKKWIMICQMNQSWQHGWRSRTSNNS
jgi:hypothetical protein